MTTPPPLTDEQRKLAQEFIFSVQTWMGDPDDKAEALDALEAANARLTYLEGEVERLRGALERADELAESVPADWGMTGVHPTLARIHEAAVIYRAALDPCDHEHFHQEGEHNVCDDCGASTIPEPREDF